MNPILPYGVIAQILCYVSDINVVYELWCTTPKLHPFQALYFFKIRPCIAIRQYHYLRRIFYEAGKRQHDRIYLQFEEDWLPRFRLEEVTHDYYNYEDQCIGLTAHHLYTLYYIDRTAPLYDRSILTNVGTFTIWYSDKMAALSINACFYEDIPLEFMPDDPVDVYLNAGNLSINWLGVIVLRDCDHVHERLIYHHETLI